MFTNTVDIKYIEYMESKPIRTLEMFESYNIRGLER